MVNNNSINKNRIVVTIVVIYGKSKSIVSILKKGTIRSLK